MNDLQIMTSLEEGVVISLITALKLWWWWVRRWSSGKRLELEIKRSRVRIPGETPFFSKEKKKKKKKKVHVEL